MKQTVPILKKWGLAFVLPVILIVVWKIAAVKVDSAVLIPSPESVLKRLCSPRKDLMGIGSLLHHAGISLLRVLIGFGFGAFLGVALGLTAGVDKTVRMLLEPFVDLMRSICPVAWIPFALVLFKLNTLEMVVGSEGTIFGEILLAMIFVIGYGAFFPVFINTLHGMSSVRSLYLETASVFGVRGFQRFRKVLFPAALPSIVTGLRIGLGTSWFVIVAAEMLPGPSTGLGYLIIYAYQMSEMDILVTGMISIGIIGGMIHLIMNRLSSRWIIWQKKER